MRCYGRILRDKSDDTSAVSNSHVHRHWYSHVSGHSPPPSSPLLLGFEDLFVKRTVTQVVRCSALSSSYTSEKQKGYKANELRGAPVPSVVSLIRPETTQINSNNISLQLLPSFRSLRDCVFVIIVSVVVLHSNASQGQRIGRILIHRRYSGCIMTLQLARSTIW
jgi:hypothetical protein